MLDGCEARRYPKIITAIHKGGPYLEKKKTDYEYNEYEFPPTGNAHPVNEESAESDHSEHHEHHHLHEHHETYLHTKSLHHTKKPAGYSAGSGLRSIAQGSADQARYLKSFLNNMNAILMNFCF